MIDFDNNEAIKFDTVADKYWTMSNMPTISNIRNNFDCSGYTSVAVDSEGITLTHFPSYLEPIKMWTTDNGYTTVKWIDGTTTSVCIEDGGHATLYGGFCACVAKKLYGKTGIALRLMQKAIDRAQWPSKKKQIELEQLKKLRAKKAEQKIEEQKKRRDQLIQDEIDIIYAKREAARIVDERDRREEKNNDCER